MYGLVAIFIVQCCVIAYLNSSNRKVSRMRLLGIQICLLIMFVHFLTNVKSNQHLNENEVKPQSGMDVRMMLLEFNKKQKKSLKLSADLDMGGASQQQNKRQGTF